MRQALKDERDVFRVKVTPDPVHAEALQRKFEALSYTPSTGQFHRDTMQPRKVSK